ncbi:MAG TPA: S53 family peptidase [Streptosporangiaceae bacterium]|nr:S53 family peptidase [Streptosporangiaceae bacterium]
MRRAPFAVAAAVGSIALSAALGGAGAALPSAGPAAGPDRPLVLISPDYRHVVGAQAAPPTTAFCEKHFGIACYLPRQVQRAYRLPALYRRGITGKGQTIVIVDSYGSPTVAHDLAVFDKAAGLPAPPSLRIIQPAGKVPPYQANDTREGWAGETELDVEYARAFAPGARILLVETPTSENEGRTGFPAIVKAEKYVIDHQLGGVISQSFSATERSFSKPSRLLSLRGAYKDAFRHRVTVLSASGDSGAADVKYDGSTYFRTPVTSWPDSDPLVTGVGGTQLHLTAQGRAVRPATVWNDTYNAPTNEFIFGDRGPTPLASGGGKSVIFARPGYQSSVRGIVGPHRGVPDISMSGACNGGVDMYQSFKGQPAGWYPTCGTSEATPEFAGIVALADQAAHRRLGLLNPDLYLLSAARARGIVDVTRGNTTVSFRQGSGNKLFRVKGAAARRGYDLASGVGTVNGPALVAELALMAKQPNWTAGELRLALAKLP